MTIDSSMIQFKDRANADSSVYPISIQKAIVDKPDGDDLTTYIAEYNISLHQRNTTAGVGTPRRDTSIFTLSEAIAQVPEEYKHGGLKLTFNSDMLGVNGVRSYVLDSSVWNGNVKSWYEEGNNALVGYYTCTTGGGTAAKTVNDASGYILSLGGSMKIRFTNKNTASSPTLNINGQGAKSIIYDGSTCSSTNTWEDGETVEVYFDGSVYQLNNVAGGGNFATGQKVREIGIDDEPVAGSGNLVKSGGVYTPLKELDLSVNGGTRTETEHHGDNEFILNASNVSNRGTVYDGNISSDSNYRSVKLQIPENTTKINAFCVARNQYYYGISFYSSSSLDVPTFISGNTISSSGSENQLIEINVPSNAAYVLVTVNASYVSNAFADFIKEILVEGLDEKVHNLETNVQELDSTVESIDENLNGKTITTEINHTSEEFNSHNVITRGSSGNYTSDQGYKTVFLPIPENTIQIKAVCFANNQYYNGLTWYKGLTLTLQNWLADYPRVSGISGDGLITINEIPENAVAIAVTAMNSDSNCYVTFTTQTFQRGLNERVDDIEGITDPLQGYFKSNNAVSSYFASMSQGDELSLITPNAFKNYSVGFSMNFDSVFDGRVSLETINTFTSGHIEIDGTNIYIYRGSDTLEKTIPHGLTISQFLSVSIIQTSIHLETAKIIVCSQSGMFINSDTDNYWYAGGSNPYKLKMISGGCVNAKLTLSIHNCNVWLFGDSYLDYLVRNVSTVVSNELTNLYMDGYPGRTSSGGLSSLNKAINIANPKILVWALGMNDGDSTSAVNADWLSAYNSVKDICKANGVELVLVTIPTTPSVNNNHKNSIIRNSGYRYVDVAMSVGADGTGEWYEGLLSSDNVHPTSAGSKVIFGKYIADLPNIF